MAEYNLKVRVLGNNSSQEEVVKAVLDNLAIFNSNAPIDLKYEAIVQNHIILERGNLD